MLVCWLAVCIPVVQAQTILVVGDSISAAYGLDIEQGWVALLQERLEHKGLPWTVVNASVSGDTTAGGRTRLPQLLAEHQPRLLVLELGGNDGLRGLPIQEMQDNLQAMIGLARQQDTQVLLLGMQIPPNYGRRYTGAFQQVYRDLAQQHSVPLVDFFLQGVGGDVELMQADGIHPTAQAQTILLENVWPHLLEVLSGLDLRVSLGWQGFFVALLSGNVRGHFQEIPPL